LRRNKSRKAYFFLEVREN